MNKPAKTPAEFHTLGLALMSRGELREARNMLALALDGEKSNLQYLLDYAQVYVELGQYDKARGFFLTALSAEPYSVLANYRLANLCKLFGRIDEAILFYGSAIAGNQSFAEAFNNRGGAFQVINRTQEALADFQRAIELKPGLEQAYLNLGRLLDTGGDFSGAEAVYAQALAAGLNPDLFGHLRDSVSKGKSSKAPLAYLRAIFDDYAPSFDLHLTKGLGYTLPDRVAEIIKQKFESSGKNLAILDLGCGTGLCGVGLAPIAAHMVGVDASPAMLDQADRRGIYHDLVEADIERYLPGVAELSVDALIAADVFIYVGDLENIFAQAARILESGGLFLFSIEYLSEPGDYRLQRTGRFQHAPAYVEALAENHGWVIEVREDFDVRLERALPVPGVLYSMRKPVRQD